VGCPRHGYSQAYAANVSFALSAVPAAFGDAPKPLIAGDFLLLVQVVKVLIAVAVGFSFR
jgi:hypothetical protein